MFERGRVYTEQHSQDLSRVSIALRLPQLGRAKTSFAETTARRMNGHDIRDLAPADVLCKMYGGYGPDVERSLDGGPTPNAV